MPLLFSMGSEQTDRHTPPRCSQRCRRLGARLSRITYTLQTHYKDTHRWVSGTSAALTRAPSSLSVSRAGAHRPSVGADHRCDHSCPRRQQQRARHQPQHPRPPRHLRRRPPRRQSRRRRRQRTKKMRMTMRRRTATSRPSPSSARSCRGARRGSAPSCPDGAGC